MNRKLIILLVSLASIFVVLLVVMLFVYKGQGSYLESQLKMPLGTMRVFLKDDITVEEQRSLDTFIRKMPEVQSVTYISKEQALEDFKEVVRGRDCA